MFKKIMRLCPVFVLFTVALSLGACSKQVDNEQADYKIGVNQYVQHPILDAVLEGLQSELGSQKSYQVIVKNSNADALTCRQVNEQFVQSGVDVLVALGTPAAQSAVAVAGDDVPVVFGAITDPVGAKLADTLETPGGNKTGTTNRWPFDQHVSLVQQLFPNARRIGVVVNPGEANCESGMRVIRATASSRNLSLVEVPVANSAEVRAAVESLKGRVDVILVSPANTVYSALDTLIGSALNIGIPVVGGDESAVKRGVVATYGFSNEAVGVATAKIVVMITEGDAEPGNIPVGCPPGAKLFYNAKAASEAKVSVPDDLLNQAVNLSE